MTTYSRTVKSNGSTEWADDEIISHTEHNSEWNTFLNDYNGNVTDANVKSNANIALTKLGDHAVDDATFIGAGSSPGETFSPTKPTSATGEIEALRYRINANNHTTNVFVRSAAGGGSNVSASWLEPPPVGKNLFENPGFEIQTGGAGTAPNGWTLSGAPTTIAIEDQAAFANTAAGVDKRSLNIIGSAVGITQTLTGLKSNTKYRVGAQFVRTANTFTMSTSGGLASSANYGNISVSDASGTGQRTFQSLIKTDGSGSDITVTFLTSGSAAAEVNLFQVWFYELSDVAPVEAPAVPAVINTVSAAFATTGTAATLTWHTITGLSATVFVPSHGYRIIISASIPFVNTDARATAQPTLFRIQSNAGTVYGPVGISSGAQDAVASVSTETAFLNWVIDDAAPGTEYAITFDIGQFDETNPQVAPVDATTSAQLSAHSIVRLERM